MGLPSKVRSLESAARLTEPTTVAPLSTTTLSQPLSPSDSTVACSSPAPPASLSVSSPAPPCSSDMPENTAPAKVNSSEPAPSLTLPAIAAPDFTVIVLSPAEPRIALRPSAPTDAPLSIEIAMEELLAASVLMAATFVAVPPETAPETVMLADPLTARPTNMPSPETPVTSPDAATDTAPVPLPTATMPLAAPDTSAAVIAIPAPLASLDAMIPSPALPVTEPLTVIDMVPPPVLRATMPLAVPLTSWPVADCTKVMPADPGCVSRKAFRSWAFTGVSE